MEKILGDFVVVGRADDGDRNNCARILFSKERTKWLQEHRFEPGRDVGDVGLHMQIAEQVDIATAEVKGSVKFDRGSWDLEG